MKSDAITRIVELSRRVATQQGADLYNKPIGSIIGPDSDRKPDSPAPVASAAPGSTPQNAKGRTTGAPERVGDAGGTDQTRPVTIERIRSLQRQLRNAMKLDNGPAIKMARKAFNEAMTGFVKNRSPEEVAQLLAGKK